MHMYEMCWTRLEETLFKEDTENIREIFSEENFSALFSFWNKVYLLASKPQDFKSDSS